MTLDTAQRFMKLEPIRHPGGLVQFYPVKEAR